MKRTLTVESAIKLQKILTKTLGRQLTDTELEEAYNNLMDFAAALIDLSDNNQSSLNQKALE